MFLLITAALVAADQLTKLWAQRSFPLNGEGLPLGLGFHLTYVKNTGAAFGILQDGTLVLGVLSALVSVLLFGYLLRRGRSIPVLQRSALILILAGALGNMIDRFRLGYVIDFVHFYVEGFSFPVFNLADSCVVIGAGLLLLSSFLSRGKDVAPPETPKRELADADFFGKDLERSPDHS